MSTGADLGDVVALGPPKEAALYFDRVLPVDLGKGFTSKAADPDLDLNIPHQGAAFSEEVVASLLPGHANAREAYVRLTLAGFAADMAHLGCSSLMAAEVFSEKIPGSPYETLFRSIGIDINQLIRSMRAGEADGDAIVDYVVERAMVPVIQEFGFSNSPAWNFKEPTLVTNEHDVSRYIATMRNLNLVDPSRVSWSQIVEFRKDAASRKALRDLRLFFAENFSGKDPGYISDKLEQLLEKHDQAVRDWGFTTKVSALSVLFTRESLFGAGAAMIVTQLGIPIALAAGAGAIVSIGRISLEFAKVQVDAKKTAIDRPVRYLSDLQSRLGGG